LSAHFFELTWGEHREGVPVSFSLSAWFQRRKIGAQVRRPGAAVEHRRISNPFHAVSIEPGSRCCVQARQAQGWRYLSTAAPMLPLEGCTSTSCQCRYVHYEDRRSNLRDRRVNFANPHAHRMTDRRAGGGRRIND
jgi:hypothetical protein